MEGKEAALILIIQLAFYQKKPSNSINYGHWLDYVLGGKN